MGKKPPPPPGSERRAHPRFELLAQIEVRADDEVSLVEIKDISASGGFIQLDQDTDLQLAPGQLLSVTLTVGDDGELGFETNARVIRRVPASGGRGPGFGLAWQTPSQEVVRSIREVLRWIRTNQRSQASGAS